jgi:hypothetical protein
VPAKKTTAAKKTTKPAEPKKDKVAVFSSGNLFHPNYGRLEKGYTILDPETAKSWMEISNKVREATPEEVAMAYGV